MAELGIIEAVLAFLSQLTPAWALVFVFGIAVFIKMIRGASIKEIFGSSNGYVRLDEYRSDAKDIKNALFEIREDQRALREAQQGFDKALAKIDGEFEQFRRK